MIVETLYSWHAPFLFHQYEILLVKIWKNEKKEVEDTTIKCTIFFLNGARAKEANKNIGKQPLALLVNQVPFSPPFSKKVYANIITSKEIKIFPLLPTYNL